MSNRYGVVIDSGAPSWAQRLATDINRALAQIAADRKPRTFAKADLPSDGSEGLAIVSDEVGGSTLAFFDGAAWRRAQDRVIVS